MTKIDNKLSGIILTAFFCVCSIFLVGCNGIKNFTDKQYLQKIFNELNVENEKLSEDSENFGLHLPSAGFYDKELKITIKTDNQAEVYFTIDGSEPMKGNPSSILYENPFLIQSEEKEKCIVLKCRAYYEDESYSKVDTRTYFVGTGVKERFDCPVFCISAEPDQLFGYENGIFTEGKLREEWQSSNPDQAITYDAPANYNLRGREGERKVTVECFDSEGSRIIRQEAGIRISGNFTRQSEQKSFQLFGRKEYDEKNEFQFPFFEEMWDLDGAVMDRFDKLKVRNAGNDRSEGFLRDELAMTLSRDAGFPETQSVRPVSVYINGQYKGIYWLHSTYDKEYFQQKYGKYDGDMIIIGKSETNMTGEGEEEAFASEYNELYQKYAAMDLTENERIKELNQLIDVANYLRYYAIQLYLSNRDWPYNNVQVFRYYSKEGEYEQDSVFDGRYRYLLFDLDTTMGLGGILGFGGEQQSYETLELLLERNHAPLFEALMQRADCREFFASYVCELANGAFSEENVMRRMTELDNMRKKEMRAYITECSLNPELPELSETYQNQHMEWIIQWAKGTRETFPALIGERFGLGQQYTVSIDLPQDCEAQLNTRQLKSGTFSGSFLEQCNNKLTPHIPFGKEFICWKVNGVPFYETELSFNGTQAIQKTLAIELVVRNKGGGLTLDAISARDTDDWILLVNASGEEISTKGFYLADENSVTKRNYLPDFMLAPGEQLFIGCREYEQFDEDYRVNFNLKKGETLILGYGTDELVDRVTIPKLSLSNGCYKKSQTTGEWLEIKNYR